MRRRVNSGALGGQILGVPMSHLDDFRRISRLVLGGLFVASSAAAQTKATSDYLDVRLPQHVELKMPRNWRVLTDDSRITLNAASEALQREINAERLPSSLPFAANHYDGNRVTAGMVNIRYYPSVDVSQALVRAMSPDDLAEIDRELRQQLTASVEGGGNRLLEWRGTNTREISGLRFIVSEYRRSSPTGKTFRVRLVRLLDTQRSFTLTVSYREDAPILRPITDYMISSLQVRGTPVRDGR
jgi:hypothetical protein